MEAKKQSEQGQALVLLVLGIIGLLGFTALAIDGGMLYSDRRDAQNAADTSSLTGAREIARYFQTEETNLDEFTCNEAWVNGGIQDSNEAAISRAGTNNYAIDAHPSSEGTPSDGNGVLTKCVDTGELNPINDEPLKYFDVVVAITADTQTSFAQFVFGGPLRNTVTSVARVRPTIPFGFGNAVVALNDQCGGNQGVSFGGSSETSIAGGGVFSNGCLTGVGNDFQLGVTDGNIDYVVGASGGGAGGLGDNMSPLPGDVNQGIPDEALIMETPVCSPFSKGSVNKSGKGDFTIEPGTYDSISVKNGTLYMNPGLYCLTGSPSALSATGGTIIGRGVTLYILNGGMKVNGNVGTDPDPPLELISPIKGVYEAVNGAIYGLLIYMAEGNDSSIDLIGNANSFYSGTIFAPDGDVSISGDSSLDDDEFASFATQIVAWNAEITGNSNVDINYQGAQLYQIPPQMELNR